MNKDAYNLVCKFSEGKTKDIIKLKESIRIALVELKGALESSKDDNVKDYLHGAIDELEKATFEGDYLD